MPGLYIHIPFCERKCIYCDFYSVERVGGIDEFLESLVAEMKLYRPMARNTTFSSLFFGGGTPSILRSDHLLRLLHEVSGCFHLGPGAEVTLETNPGTVDEEKLRMLRGAGVTRLSIGVQSFDDNDLRFLGRIHNSETAVRCVEWARSAGFDNVSMDLIFSLPGQTRERWIETLRRAVGVGPEHISAYSLIVEEGTPLARMVTSGRVTPLPEEKDAELYCATIEFLEKHGYHQYEVSNFAKPGRQSRHNVGYWNHERYLGLGPSSHSFWNGKRWWNVGTLQSYRDALSNEMKPVAGEELLSKQQLRDEAVMLNMRTGKLDLAEMRARYGFDPTDRTMEIIQRVVDSRYASFCDQILQITPQGFPYCDEISADLLASL